MVVLGEVEGGGRLKATNESFRLVGGLFGWGQGWRDVESHQRVMMTCWWLFWARSSVAGARKPPTSCDDLLVVVLGEVEGGGMWRATNESSRLVNGCFG